MGLGQKMHVLGLLAILHVTRIKTKKEGQAPQEHRNIQCADFSAESEQKQLPSESTCSIIDRIGILQILKVWFERDFHLFSTECHGV